jgi:hypothetical protein
MRNNGLQSFILSERLELKEALKLTASNVLGSAYRQRVVVRNNPNDRAAILSQFRNFRKFMVQFFNIAK